VSAFRPPASSLFRASATHRRTGPRSGFKSATALWTSKPHGRSLDRAGNGIGTRTASRSNTPAMSLQSRNPNSSSLEQTVIHAIKIGPETLRKQRPALTKNAMECAMDYHPLPPVEYLRQCFSYDPKTGDLTWRIRPRSLFDTDKGWRIANTKAAGKPALRTRTKFGFAGNINAVPVKTARVIFTIYHGREPNGFIDHINGNCFDNRIENLREVDKLANAQNRARVASSRRTYHGVGARNSKWFAVIRVAGKDHWLGTYLTEREAIAARKRAEKSFGFHPNHGRPPMRRAD